MNRSVRILALYLAAVFGGMLAEVASAQTTSITSPTGGIQMGGVALAQGTAVFIPIDAYGHAIAVTTSGGGLNLPGSAQKPVGYSCTITAGALSGCSVPDENTAAPSGFRYNIVITDTSTFGHATSGMSFTLPSVGGITGSTYALQDYSPTASVPTLAALTLTTGSGAPTTACTAPGPCEYFDTAGHGEYFSTGGSWTEIIGGSFSPGGDLGGTASSQIVTGLQGHPVASTAPAVGNVPTWNGSAYVPATPSSAGAGNLVALSTTSCVPNPVDLATGTVPGTWTVPSDPTSCINSYFAAHPGVQLLNDLPSGTGISSSGITVPPLSALISMVKPSMAVVTITGYSISSNVITFTTKPQTLAAGQGIVINGFPTSTFLNGPNFVSGAAGAGLPLLVLSSGLSSTQFSASSPSFTHANVSATTEAGLGFIPQGNGIFQRAGAAGHIVQNAAPTNTAICPGGYMDPGYNQPYSNLPALRGGYTLVNQFINGNAANVTNNTGGFSLGAAYCTNTGVAFLDSSGNTMTGNYLYAVTGYNTFLRNTSRDVVSGNTFLPFGPGVGIIENNLDGIHVDAPASYFTFDGNIIGSGDDAFALNAAEGWPGLISDGVISNTVYAGALDGGRMYTNSTAAPSGYPQPSIQRITETGGTGDVTVAGVIGNEGTTSKTVFGTMQDISIVNNHFNLTPYAGGASPDTGTAFVISDNIDNIYFADDTVTNIYNTTARGLVNLTAGATVNSLTFGPGMETYRTSSGSTVNSFVDMADGYYSSAGTNHIGTLAFESGRVVDTIGGPYAGLPQAIKMGSSTITSKLTGSYNLDLTNFTSLIDTPGQVANFELANNMMCSSPSQYVLGESFGGFPTVCPKTNFSFLLSLNGGRLIQEPSTNAGTDQNIWDSMVSGTTLHFRLVNDADSAANDYMTVTRSATNVTAIALPAPVAMVKQVTLSDPSGGSTINGYVGQYAYGGHAAGFQTAANRDTRTGAASDTAATRIFNGCNVGTSASATSCSFNLETGVATGVYSTPLLVSPTGVSSVANVYTVASLPALVTVSGSTGPSPGAPGTMVVVSDSASYTPGACTGGGSYYMVAVATPSGWTCH